MVNPLLSGDYERNLQFFNNCTCLVKRRKDENLKDNYSDLKLSK